MFRNQRQQKHVPIKTNVGKVYIKQQGNMPTSKSKNPINFGKKNISVVTSQEIAAAKAEVLQPANTVAEGYSRTQAYKVYQQNNGMPGSVAIADALENPQGNYGK